MRLYHGSLEKVEAPRIIPSEHTSDYGTGFYTTTSYEQAEKWVRRKYKLVDQMLFHTERSLKSLTFIESREVML